MKLFTNDSKFDIYIYSPPYKRASAGVTVLYTLCDNLNRRGIPAYIVPDIKYFGIFGYSYFSGAGSLITPTLTEHKIKQSIAEKRVPIVIYPETIFGNPLNFKNIVRYLLYYNEELGKVDSLSTCEHEAVLYYSEDIKQKSLQSICKAKFFQRLTMPIQNPSKYSKHFGVVREGSYYYAEKFINVHGADVPNDIKKSSVRITRDQADSPSPDELVRILSSAKLIHVFEDTAIIYEALLAGCVVNIHPSGKYGGNTNGSATSEELGLSGTISQYAVSEEDISIAQKLLSEHAKNYESWIGKSISDIDEFVGTLENFSNGYDNVIFYELLSRARDFEKYSRKIHLDNTGKVFKISFLNYLGRFIRSFLPEKLKKSLHQNLKKYGKKLSPSIRAKLISLYSKLTR